MKNIVIKDGVEKQTLEINKGEEYIVSFGGNKKLNFEAVLAGEGASLRMIGRFNGKGDDGEDITLRIVQKAPRTRVYIEMRSVLADKSYSFFDGLIRMEGDVEGSSSNMSYRALLLSDTAKSKPIPKLEILNKKIASAKHEASVGKIDMGQLFYLQSRGVSREEAEKIIVDGFLASSNTPALV